MTMHELLLSVLSCTAEDVFRDATFNFNACSVHAAQQHAYRSLLSCKPLDDVIPQLLRRLCSRLPGKATRRCAVRSCECHLL
jgi:predicted AAA+ superfamily ATPase